MPPDRHGRWRLIPRAPIGTTPRRMQFRDGCRVVDRPRYAIRTEARALQARRRALWLDFPALAARTGLQVREALDLIRGAVDLAEPADWPRLLATLED